MHLADLASYLEADGRLRALYAEPEAWARLHEPDWRPCSHSVAFTARFTRERIYFHVILNAYWEPLEFELSSVANGGRHPWRRWIDTFLDSS